MAAACTENASLLCVEHQALQRDEHPARILLDEFVVETTEDLVGPLDLPGERAQHGHGDSHEERGRNALPRHVSQRHDDTRVGHPQHLVEIAAHLTSRFDHRVNVEPGSSRQRRRVGRQDAHLDFAGNAKVSSHRVANSVCVRLRFEQRANPRLDLEQLERLRQVIVAAYLKAVRLVLDVFERTEKHHGHFARGLACAQLTAHLVPVETRHHDVEQHEVG